MGQNFDPMRKPITSVFIALLVSSVAIWAQPTAADPSADFSIQKQGAGFQFKPILPVQQSIPGAPLPYYDYYWEFGDGGYSFEKEPQHT